MPRCATPDAVTARFRALADHWRDIAGLDDATVAELIRRDGIDVLVDLTGHTAGSRLLVFARRPAPVQVAYLLGHGYTSGLSAMDAFLADAVLAPPGADALFSERIDPAAAHSAGLRAARRDAAGRHTSRAHQWLHHVRIFRSDGSAERRGDRRMGTHPARGAGRATGAEQCAVPGTGIPRPHRRAVCRAGHRPRPARADRHSATAAHLGRLWRDRHRARSIPAQRRHHDDRGAVAGRSRHFAGRTTERRTVRRDDPARGRNGRLGQRATSTTTSRAPSPRRPTCTNSRACAPTLRQRVADSPLCDAADLARHVEAAYRDAVATSC